MQKQLLLEYIDTGVGAEIEVGEQPNEQGNLGETRVGVQSTKKGDIPNVVDETWVGVQGNFGETGVGVQEEGDIPKAIDETLGGQHLSEVEVEPRQDFDPFGDFNPFWSAQEDDRQVEGEGHEQTDDEDSDYNMDETPLAEEMDADMTNFDSVVDWNAGLGKLKTWMMRTPWKKVENL
ncbi:hypothetical protein L6452_08645 [Arctium lappa]|uniref:Uncharacterized protein n=1 Tax=Arctium lappa TaxID=4217 RepID=A0ACB9DIA1_ARCLA|nr:hypothetical protein L6452_08645 [Arctium lappa]